MISGSGVIFMSLRDEVRDLIGDFYDGDLTARQFREKFAPLYSQSDIYVSEIQNLFIDIDSIYAEYIMGKIDETELRKQLFEFLPSTRIQTPEISNSKQLWSLPIAPTENHSPRIRSRQSTRTNPQSADIVFTR
jgi:hypothetical protein